MDRARELLRSGAWLTRERIRLIAAAVLIASAAGFLYLVVTAHGLVDVQAHSSTHRRMTRLSDAELDDEVAGAKEELERHLPYAITSFSYPAGLYSPREMRAVEMAGFRGGVTTRPGVNPGGVGLGDLRRTMIHCNDRVAVPSERWYWESPARKSYSFISGCSR